MIGEALTLDSFDTTRDAFAVRGDEMRTHAGRSVVAIAVNGQPHFLKRYWFTPSQLFKRHVARGFHELRMIDWLNDNGFAGPKVVRRGFAGMHPFVTRLYFLMQEVPGEKPLERAWRDADANVSASVSAGGCVSDGDGASDSGREMLCAAARFAARLHDAGFIHTDFSERHILVGQSERNNNSKGETNRKGNGKGNGEWTFRLIDLERASVGRIDHRRCAADLATLMASVADDELRQAIRHEFLTTYLESRTTLPRDLDFRSLVEHAKPTKVF